MKKGFFSNLFRSKDIEKKGRFSEILEDKNLYKEFEKFLEKEHAQENLWFYRDVALFSKSTFEDKNDMKDEAKKICTKYLGMGGEEKELSIGDDLIQDTIKSLDTCHSHMFDLLSSEIEAILKTKYLSFQESS